MIKLSGEKIAALRKSWDNMNSPYEAAKKVGCSPTTAKRYFVDFDWELGPDFYNRMSDEELIKYGQDRDYLGKTYPELSRSGIGYHFYMEFHRKHLFDIYFRTGKNRVGLISSAIKADPKLAENLVKLCHGDESDIVDILAVVHDAPRERVLAFLRKPSIRKYLGDYKKGSRSIMDIKDVGMAAQTLYQRFKDKIILEKLRKTLRNYSRERLGPMPKDEDFESLIRELEKGLYENIR